jgi:Holliday junction resolvase RusA-like endonuclease
MGGIMTDGLSFTVPGAPVPKARPRVTKTGHTYTPKRTKDYEDEVAGCFIEAYQGARPAFPNQDVGLHVLVYESGKRYADVDNYLKIVSDALNGLAYTDDKQVSLAFVAVERESTEPRIDVRIYTFEEEES